MKVLHVLANSPPDVNGYAVRTHKILTSQTNELICPNIAMVSRHQIQWLVIIKTMMFNTYELYLVSSEDSMIEQSQIQS